MPYSNIQARSRFWIRSQLILYVERPIAVEVLVQIISLALKKSPYRVRIVFTSYRMHIVFLSVVLLIK